MTVFCPKHGPKINDLTKGATLSASNDCDPEPVRDGWSRQIEDDTHAWEGGPGDWLSYEFDAAQVDELAVAFDTSMELTPDELEYALCRPAPDSLPDTLVQRFTVEIKVAGNWTTHVDEANNIHRYRRLSIGKECRRCPASDRPLPRQRRPGPRVYVRVATRRSHWSLVIGHWSLGREQEVVGQE